MKLFLTLSLGFFLLVLFSCSKKQDVVVTPIGAISISGIHESDTLKGTISTQVTVAGSVQPSKINVYANDSLIATSNKAPYNLQWNTLGVSNGNYKLKAIAYDNAGKETQMSLDVIVSNILVTLVIDPKINSIYSNIVYIVTDSAGNILNSVKYNGESNIAIASSHPNLNSRCSVFEIKTAPSSQTYITGYMTIPKGSVWDLRGITEINPPHWYNASLNFTNFPAFSSMTISTDELGFSFGSPQQVANITNYGFSSTTKEYVQYVDLNNNGHYGFFPLDTNATSITMNLADSTFSNSIKKSLTINGASNINLILYGRWNKNYYSYYLLDNAYSSNSNLTYFYPDGNYLSDYISNVYYEQNGWVYSTDYTSLPPDAIIPFGTTATINNNTLNSFSFTPQGSFDYYSATFSDVTDKAFATIYSTSAFTSFKFPDILKLTNIANASLSNFKPFSFTMAKVPGFNESKLIYYNPNEFPGLTLPSQSATKNFY
ncbi:MAG TPA: Ig-like domain-containing protein [Mucilaginibacter sp.]|nr:Ig-like domain-containing protein [Mucilaginibacter sp.]